MSVTPLTASTGTYTPPTAPAAQATTFTVSGTYLSVLGGTCRLGIAFNRASLPATMSISGGGGATLAYTIQSSPTGGTTLLYTGGGTPAASSLLTTSFTASVLGLAVPFSANLTAYTLAQPTNPQAAGSYSDTTPTLKTFNITIANVVTALTTSPFTVTGNVAKVCTIGVSHRAPTARRFRFPVVQSTRRRSSNPTGTQPATRLPMCSSHPKMAASNSATRVSGFTNVINYAAAATFSGAIAPINTASNPSASGPVSGPAVPTTGATPSGTLQATITPQANVLSLLSGSYADTLSITITPQ